MEKRPEAAATTMMAIGRKGLAAPTNVIPSYPLEVATSTARPPASAATTSLSTPYNTRTKHRQPKISRPRSIRTHLRPPPPPRRTRLTRLAPPECFSTALVTTSPRQNPCPDTSPSSSHARHRNTPFLLPLVRYSPGTNTSLP